MNTHSNRRAHSPHGRALRRPARAAISLATAVMLSAMLAACSSSDDATPEPPAPPPPPPLVTISGVLADGPLQGALVCYDTNNNGICEAGEASATSDVDGKFNLQVAEFFVGRHTVVAQVPATAIDKDTAAAVGAAFTLLAPPTGTAGAHSVFVSPLTTVVAQISADDGKTLAQATAEVQSALNLSVSPLADFTAAGGDAGAALAARALGAVLIETSKLANLSSVPDAQKAMLLRNATNTQLAQVADSLAASVGGTAAARTAAVVSAVHENLNLVASTVAAVAAQVAKPAGTADAPGPFISVRRFAYTDANNYSYTVFTGDSSQLNTAGEYVANEVRKTQTAGADVPYNRNQVYWTGTAWQTCNLQWQVITAIKAATATTPQTAAYCGGQRSESRATVEDLGGKTLREVLTQMRAYPLADGTGAHTNSAGLPVSWGPEPTLVPATAVFPAGAKLSARTGRVDIGGTDRIELTTKASVRWADGVFRQATTLEQYSGMPGNLVDAAAAITTSNTVFIFDLPLDAQPDATLESFKRYRAGFDVAGLKIRFYACDVRKTDTANLNCLPKGDGTLAISTQGSNSSQVTNASGITGSARLLRVASGYPAELTARLNQQRFFAEYAGNVFRGVRDLERTRFDQRLNKTAWDALRTALNIPAHVEAVAPLENGPGVTLRNFSFTDALNYNWRTFDGDSNLLDGQGRYGANENRLTVSAGVVQPFVRNRSYWTGTEWTGCASDGRNVVSVNTKAPFDALYCKAYLDERLVSPVLTLDGRRMSDVVSDIRAFGGKDGTSTYGGWGPSPTANPALASAFFPVGSTMDYRGNIGKSTPLAIATAAGDRLRVAPAFNTTAAFDTWPFAQTLDDLVAKYPGDVVAPRSLNGNVAVFVHGYDLAAAPSPLYTRRVEIRVAFDAIGNKARFYQNNRAVTTNFTANYSALLDTTYSVQTMGGVKVLSFAALPANFEADFNFTRHFAERDGSVWYAFKDRLPSTPGWTIRLNGTAFDALRAALGIQ